MPPRSTATFAIEGRAVRTRSRSSASRPGCGVTPISPLSSSGCANTTTASRQASRPHTSGSTSITCEVRSRRSFSYLDSVDPEAAAVARERCGCLTPWQREPSTYGRAVLTKGYRKCEAEVIRQCQDILGKQLDYAASDPDSFLDAAQNARLVASAERYYRIMYYGGAESWNLRDTHMFETLGHILDAQGPRSKAVVWAHNSHIGEARFTEMGAVREELNIGQLCREKFADAACLIGFGTHTGTVAAASDWDGEMEVMQVRPSRPDSYERQFHDAGVARGLLEFRRRPPRHLPIRPLTAAGAAGFPRGHFGSLDGGVGAADSCRLSRSRGERTARGGVSKGYLRGRYDAQRGRKK